jgi:hypothetical protein
MAELFKTLEFKDIERETLGKYAHFIDLGDKTYDVGGSSIPMLMTLDTTIKKLKEMYQGIEFDKLSLVTKKMIDLPTNGA